MLEEGYTFAGAGEEPESAAKGVERMQLLVDGLKALEAEFGTKGLKPEGYEGLFGEPEKLMAGEGITLTMEQVGRASLEGGMPGTGNVIDIDMLDDVLKGFVLEHQGIPISEQVVEILEQRGYEFEEIAGAAPTSEEKATILKRLKDGVLGKWKKNRDVVAKYKSVGDYLRREQKVIVDAGKRSGMRESVGSAVFAAAKETPDFATYLSIANQQSIMELAMKLQDKLKTDSFASMEGWEQVGKSEQERTAYPEGKFGENGLEQRAMKSLSIAMAGRQYDMGGNHVRARDVLRALRDTIISHRLSEQAALRLLGMAMKPGRASTYLEAQTTMGSELKDVWASLMIQDAGSNRSREARKELDTLMNTPPSEGQAGVHLSQILQLCLESQTEMRPEARKMVSNELAKQKLKEYCLRFYKGVLPEVARQIQQMEAARAAQFPGQPITFNHYLKIYVATITHLGIPPEVSERQHRGRVAMVTRRDSDESDSEGERSRASSGGRKRSKRRGRVSAIKQPEDKTPWVPSNNKGIIMEDIPGDKEKTRYMSRAGKNVSTRDPRSQREQRPWEYGDKGESRGRSDRRGDGNGGSRNDRGQFQNRGREREERNSGDFRSHNKYFNGEKGGNNYTNYGRAAGRKGQQDERGERSGTRDKWRGRGERSGRSERGETGDDEKRPRYISARERLRNTECFGCKRMGHQKRDCGTNACYICHKEGHPMRDCPEEERRQEERNAGGRSEKRNQD